MSNKKYTTITCIIFLLLGMIIGAAVKKTATPLFSWGNGEVNILEDGYK